MLAIIAGDDIEASTDSSIDVDQDGACRKGVLTPESQHENKAKQSLGKLGNRMCDFATRELESQIEEDELKYLGERVKLLLDLARSCEE